MRGAWGVGVLLLVACGGMGSGYSAEQITAIQQGTPYAVVLTALPVTPGAAAYVGIGGVEPPAVQAAWTVEAATRVAGEGTRQSEAATRGAAEATLVSVQITQDAAAFANELASANIQLQAEQELTGLQVTLAAQAISTTIQAMEYQAKIDAADVASAEQQLYWFSQVQEAEAQKALSQAEFYETARYVLMVVAIALGSAVALWWFWLRPRNEVRVVTVNGRDMAMVKTPNGYAPIITSMQARLPQPNDEQDEPQPPSAVPPTLPSLVELPDNIKRDVLQIGVFENGAPMHFGPGFRGILVTGEPGSGKSTFLRQLVAQALQHGWVIYLADGEQITFQPHLWGEVAKSQAEVVAWLKWLKGDVVDKRHELYRRVSALIEDTLPPAQQFLVEDLTGYNRAAQMFDLPIMRPLLIGWDEANKTLGDKHVQIQFDDLAQSARKVGGELIVSGHDWRATQIPKGSSSYLPGRVAFRSEKTSSEVVLRGDSSAMHIPFDRKGLAYVQMHQWRGFMQGYFLPDARLIQMVREMRPRQELPESAAWKGYTVTHERPTSIPAEVDLNSLITESQAETDAARLLDSVQSNGSLRSRRQVALRLAGNDNADGYARGDAALKILSQQGHQWAGNLLETDARYAA